MTGINRILLVNDTRGAHEYLYRAFLEMGIHCDLATFGWPTINEIQGAFNFDPLRKLGAVGKPFRPLINLAKVGQLDDYDVASFVHRISVVDRPIALRYVDTPWLRRKCKLMSYTALGCDEIAFIAGNDQLPYSPCETCQKYDDTKNYCPNVVRKLNSRARTVLDKNFDCVFSTAVEYSHVESMTSAQSYRMPLPLDISEVPWEPAGRNRSGNSKIKIVHTPSRQGFKGTAVVMRAMEILAEERSDYDFRVISGLSFDDYIKAISEADIVVDQVWSQSPGMNALWLLAMGKIVFSGNSILAQQYFDFAASSPIVDAQPDSELLAQSLSAMIDRRHEFPEIAELGRHYVNSNHSHLKVAQSYLGIWASLIEQI